ncbi:unnamed protein product, partial [Musa hybrid cultivar]
MYGVRSRGSVNDEVNKARPLFLHQLQIRGSKLHATIRKNERSCRERKRRSDP